MKRIYDLFAGKEIQTETYTGIVCGYSSDKIILAVDGNPKPSFKRLDKDSWVADYWRTGNHRFIYSNEANIEKYLGIRGVYEKVA